MRSAVVCLLLVGLAACSSPSESGSGSSPGSSGDGGSGAYDEDTVRTGLAEAFAGSNPTPREARAGDCIADELLATASPEQLRDGGLVADDGGAVSKLPPLPDDLAGVAADATLSCIDVVQASTRAVSSARKGDLDSKAYAACLVDAVPPPAQRAALVATLAAKYDDPAVVRLGQAQADCAAEQD